jgi:hypothetical protein
MASGERWGGGGGGSGLPSSGFIELLLNLFLFKLNKSFKFIYQFLNICGIFQIILL